MTRASVKYRFLEHTADIKFRIYGSNLNKIFENCALALSEIISRKQKVKSKFTKKLKIKSQNNEELLYKFIDEIIYLLDAKNFLVSKSKVKIKDNKLEAEILGDNVKNYENLDHIKAATYHDMHIKKTSKGWEAQVIVDV